MCFHKSHGSAVGVQRYKVLAPCRPALTSSTSDENARAVRLVVTREAAFPTFVSALVCPSRKYAPNICDRKATVANHEVKQVGPLDSVREVFEDKL